MSFVTLSPDNARYKNLRDDLRVNVSSGVLTLRDGTAGGIPVADPTFGFPATVYSQTERPSGIQGWTLQQLMNEFPAYSRISFDPASVGAQLMTPMSMLYDELHDEMLRTERSLTPKFYPLYEQGVVYEYDFNTSSNLSTSPPVSGRLGDQWFDLPITKDPTQFWLGPPTRFETTTAEVFGLDVVGWTGTTHSGVNVVISGSVDTPLHNRLVFEVSGASEFRYAITEDEPAVYAEARIRGRWANDSLRPDAPVRRERILIDRNGPFFTDNIYSSIESLEVIGLPSGTQLRLSAFNFQADWRTDSLVRYQRPVRNDLPQFAVWQNVNENTNFTQVTQTESAVPLAASGQSYLARTYVQFDTFQERDIEFDTIDLWALHDRDGNRISGVVDIVQVPSSRYLLALDRQSNLHVFDTFIPSLKLGGRAPVRPSPIYLETEWPAGADGPAETFGSYTLKVAPRYSAGQSAVQLDRWQWRLTKNTTDYIVTGESTLTTFGEKDGWRVHSSGTLSPIEITVDDPGQYTIELRIIDRFGEQYRTTTAHQKIAKRAISTCPINALAGNPSGLDIDAYGRPWVQTSTSGAVRLVMRTDIGYWDEEGKVLLTREPYDEVRNNG